MGTKKAPAGALSPSTVLLRGILSVYKTETAILCSQNIRMSLLGRKKPLRARSALAPCFFVFPTYRFCLFLRQNSYIVSSKNKNVSFWEKEAPAAAPSPSTVLLRGILSVFVCFLDKKNYIAFSKNKNVSFWEKKKPLRARSARAQYF